MGNKADIIWIDIAKSSNEYARNAICRLDNLSVVSVKEQTAGRGQAGNSWESKAGENLTFSIVLKNPEISSTEQFAISQLTSLAVIDLLAGHGITAEIKWPNDIYVGDKKICGILIENALAGPAIRWSIVGIGLNVNQTGFPSHIPNPTSMALEVQDRKFDCSELIEELLDLFSSYYGRYLNATGGLKKLRQLYLSQLRHKDQPHMFRDLRSGQPVEFTGTIRSVTPAGYLIVENGDGDMMNFTFKEITY